MPGEIRTLSDEELDAIVLSGSDGEKVLIRSHLEPLSTETRRALRVALDELENEGEPVPEPSQSVEQRLTTARGGAAAP